MKIADLFSFGRREREVLDYVDRHLELVIRTIESFDRFVKLVGQTKWEDANSEYQTIDSLETEADNLHREGNTKIAHGAFFGGIREDILNIMEKIDSIADSAKDSAKVLLEKRLDDGVASALFNSAEMTNFVRSCMNTVISLREVVRALHMNRKSVLSKVHTVENFEEEADEHKDAVRGMISSMALKTDALSLVRLREFTTLLDNVADNAEDATDVILILVAKGYS